MKKRIVLILCFILCLLQVSHAFSQIKYRISTYTARDGKSKLKIYAFKDYIPVYCDSGTQVIELEHRNNRNVVTLYYDMTLDKFTKNSSALIGETNKGFGCKELYGYFKWESLMINRLENSFKVFHIKNKRLIYPKKESEEPPPVCKKKVFEEVLYGRVVELVYHCYKHEGAFPYVEEEIPVYIIAYGYQDA